MKEQQEPQKTANIQLSSTTDPTPNNQLLNKVLLKGSSALFPAFFFPET
jgi:hypothetical protein